MILWVRHGQSTWNVLDRMQGHTVHPPLTDLGVEQAERAATALESRGAACIVSSPAVRAIQTAGVIAARLGLELRTELLLMERGLDESVESVLARIHEFLSLDLSEPVVSVSHGDTIALAVGLLSGQPLQLPAHCSITTVDPVTRLVTVAQVTD